MAAAPKMERTKTPGVYKQGKKYVVVFRDGDGRQRKERFRTYDLARRAKSKRENEVAEGRFEPAGKTTFREFAANWIDGYGGKRHEVRARTRSDYRRHLTIYAFRFFSDSKLLTAIAPKDIDDFVAWLRSERKQGRKRPPRQSNGSWFPFDSVSRPHIATAWFAATRSSAPSYPSPRRCKRTTTFRRR